MTTFVNFSPSPQSPFQFQPTLDGDVYSGIVTWGLFGRRYYLNLFTLGGVLIFSLPLIGSSVGVEIQSITWERGFVTVTTAAAHGYRIGATLDLTISGAAPDSLNGKFPALITSQDTFRFPLAADPGDATALGIVSYDINIAAGYFNSTLVYREPNSQFEINP